MGEVIENHEEFMADLNLKALERKRVLKDVASRGAAAKAAPSPSRTPTGELSRCGQREMFGQNQDSQYEVLEKIGEGATASVYKCQQGGKVFAVKVINIRNLRLQPNFQRVSEKLHRETTILFSLRHPHIVSLIDWFEEPDKLYLVMELVEGGDLLDYIRGKFHFSESETYGQPCLNETHCRQVFLQLVDALRYIHSRGVVHRDLKPDNILVDGHPAGGYLTVKISDFGHSKLVADGYSTPVTRVGTPQYWAPEVSDARTAAQGYTEKVDLWSLGVVLYVMLEGTYPFAEGQNESLGMGHQMRIGHIEFTNTQNPHAQDIIRQLIQVRPDKRLSLDKCAKHPWVTAAGSLDRPLVTAQSDWHSAAWEECVHLPHEPLDPQQLRHDLGFFTKKSKFTATLRRGEAAPEVVVTWREACDKDKDAARDELMRLLGHHFPDGNFAQKPRARQAGHVLSTVAEERPPSRSQKKGSFRLVPHTLRVLAVSDAEEPTAGLDLKQERGGMKVISVCDFPGQPGLQADDLIVKINEVSLAGLDKDVVVDLFAQHFHDGVHLMIRRRVEPHRV